MSILLHLFALIVALLLFGSIGYRLAKRSRKLVSLIAGIVIILVTISVFGIMPSTILVGIYELKTYVSYSLMALILGIVVGLVVLEIKHRKREDANA
jgi:predicted permease